MSAATEIDRVHALVDPIASDLGLDVYDIERRGATIRVTLDTPAGSDGGITLDTLSLATRLVSRELDHADPIAGHYTLEVTSPGLERPLRTPAHFRREVGKDVTVRLRHSSSGMKRGRPGRRCRFRTTFCRFRPSFSRVRQGRFPFRDRYSQTADSGRQMVVASSAAGASLTTGAWPRTLP